ncbi:MAG TPA: hypothetical protein VLB67_12465 [Acidimicrobiia bacterium]|nr:hypothetical protein [Acidimicrobiia bacterium]
MAVALYVLVAALLTACSSGAVADTSEATPATTSPAPETTTSAVDDPALAAAYEFIASYNDGDTDAVVAYFVDGGDYAADTVPSDTPFAGRGREDVAEFLAWSAASDTNMVHAECMVDPSAPAGSVDCTFMWDDLLRRTIGYVPLPGGATMTINADGTLSSYQSLLVLRAGAAFGIYMDWLSGASPDEADLAGQVGWNSVDEAIESGRARARYVDEWASTLTP